MKKSFKAPLTFTLLSLIVGALPMISVLFAGVVASAAGCRLDEGGVHSCLVLGVDIGGLLYTMGVLGWLLLISIPLAVTGVVIGLIWFVIVAIRN